MNSEISSSPFVHRMSGMNFQTDVNLTPKVHPLGAALLTKNLVICRGLPGSGKTTIAKTLTMIGYRHFEADMFFEISGKYRYDASRIRDAHDWCKRMTRDALQRGENVVVSNTFTRLAEMAPYHEMGANQVRVIEATGHWENRHGVPIEMVQRMAARWEIFPSVINGRGVENESA